MSLGIQRQAARRVALSVTYIQPSVRVTAVRLGGCRGASARLTWSVQVVLLESVLKGSMAEEQGTSTYPQIQDPGHRRDHCHSLKRAWDNEDYPQLQAPSSVSPTDERRRVSDVMSPLLLCWLKLTQQRSCHEGGLRESLPGEIMNSLWNSAKPNSKDCQNTKINKSFWLSVRQFKAQYPAYTANVLHDDL